MRKAVCVVSGLCALMLGGCVALTGYQAQRRALQFDVHAPDLRLNDTEKLALSVAIYTPDPPTYRIVYCPSEQAQATSRGGITQPMDQTAQEGAYMRVDLAMLEAARQSFGQLFGRVVTVRQLPAPGEFDAVLDVRVNELKHTNWTIGDINNYGGTIFQLTEDWSIRILDKRNVEIYTRTGSAVSPKVRQEVKASITTTKQDLDAMQSESYVLWENALSRLAEQAAGDMVRAVADSHKVHAYAESAR